MIENLSLFPTPFTQKLHLIRNKGVMNDLIDERCVRRSVFKMCGDDEMPLTL